MAAHFILDCQDRGVKRRANVLAAVAASGLVVGLAAFFVEPPSREHPPTEPPRSPLAAVASSAPLAEPPRKGDDAALAAALAQAIELAHDLDPAAESQLAEILAAAERAGADAVARRARGETEKLRAALARQARETATWLAQEARALAGEVSPAGMGRFAEAIAAAREAGDPAAAARLERERDALRLELERRHVNDVVKKLRDGVRVADGSDDPDEAVQQGFARLTRGEVAAVAPLLQKLVKRAEASHGIAACTSALHDIALARAAIDEAVTLTHDEAPFRGLRDKLAGNELRCRIEEGGRAIRRGDGAAAELLDLGALTRLDGTAPANPHILYLVGRALEADGRADEARGRYLTAIGTATWLPNDAPIEILRWLARCRAASKQISEHSPGGPGWRRLPRARFTLFQENKAGKLAARVEADRARALSRLAFGDPIRVQASKTVVFVFASEESYRSSGLSPRPWAGGHASWDWLEDGPASTICVYMPGQGARFDVDDVLGHEWAHVLVEEHTRGASLPSWAVEGVATWTERDTERQHFLDFLNRKGVKPVPWPQAITAWSDWRYRGEDPNWAYHFYAQSLLAFDVVGRRAGSAGSALLAIERLAGAEDPFKALGFLDREDFEKLAASVLAGGK